MDHKRKTSSGCYPSRHHGNKRRRTEEKSLSSSTKYTKIEECKQELSRFLEDKANIKQPKEFWVFYERYLSLQKQPRDPNVDPNVMLNTCFQEKRNVLWNKIPLLNRHGEKISISEDYFNEFLLIIHIYQDFLQKSKFLKLKKLRTSQNDLPIFQYKKEIIDKLKFGKVMLIAGNTGCLPLIKRYTNKRYDINSQNVEPIAIEKLLENSCSLSRNFNRYDYVFLFAPVKELILELHPEQTFPRVKNATFLPLMATCSIPKEEVAEYLGNCFISKDAIPLSARQATAKDAIPYKLTHHASPYTQRSQSQCRTPSNNRTDFVYTRASQLIRS